MNKKQKEKILDQYYASLINIFSISLFVLFLIFLVLLFPTFLTMKVDQKIVSGQLNSIQIDIQSMRNLNQNSTTTVIDNDIALLSASTTNKTVVIYNEIKDIYQQTPNVRLNNISIDILNKRIVVSATIDNKNTASLLVDKLNNSRYKGAELPFSVFTQSKSFIFNQNLTYE